MRVKGRGSLTSGLMLVGEGPGPQEDKVGQCFIGKTGKELDRHLDGDRLPSREDWFITNLYRQYGGKDYEWTNEDLERDSVLLLAEFRLAKPHVVVTMGRHSTRHFLGDVSMDDVHGLPWATCFDGADIVVFPLYHIAAGFHNPEISGYVSYDFQQLVAYFEGKLVARKLYDDPHPSPIYTEITDESQIVITPGVPVAIDTEGYPRAPWSAQFSQVPGRASVVRANRPDLVDAFGRKLRASGCKVTFHNSLHDLTTMRAMGIETADLPFDDTMVMAYLLQVEPKGLKPLCIRHCNMKMDSYEDIMGDAQNRIAYDYFVSLWDIEQYDYEEAQQEEFARLKSERWIDKRGKERVGRKVRTLPKLPRTALHKAVERGLRSREPYKLWQKWEDDQLPIRVAAYNRLGDLPEATLDHVESSKAIQYGGRDSDGTGRLTGELSARIDSLGLRDCYGLELGTYPLIDRMHTIGVKPDLEHFANLSRKLATEIDSIQVRLEKETGIEGFNANSGDQVADYVFDRLGLEGYKRTESGRFSTNDKVLEALEHEHPEYPVISTVREFREVYKLKHTFVDRIPDFVRRWPHDGRIHASFRTTRVVTGRLAASDPNLLAQPKHGKFAKEFRRGWVAEEGHLLGEWDLSQIELRVLAHLSQDPTMLAIFRGELRNPDGSLIDLHAALAERIFGVKPANQDKSKHRLPAKAVNFGLPMGMTNKGLSAELRKNGLEVDEDDAQRWIDETDALYKGVPPYKARMVAEAKRLGYIRCLSGRIRYIGGIKAYDEAIRSEAERFAFSTPIQEGAQWVMKQNEVAVWKEVIVPYERQGTYVQPLLQVHDALTLEFNPKVALDLNRQMVDIMTRTPKGFSVPIETSGDYGPNQADMKEF